jgi:hypothetical protein
VLMTVKRMAIGGAPAFFALNRPPLASAKPSLAARVARMAAVW